MKSQIYLILFWLLSYPCVAWATHEEDLVSDEFNRADSTDLGSSWDGGYSDSANLQIFNNQVRPTIVNGDNLESLNGYDEMNAHAQITIRTFSGKILLIASVCVRTSPPPTDTRYCASAVKNHSTIRTEISKIINGNDTILVSENSSSWTPGDTLRIDAVGNIITARRNNGSILSVQDDSIPGQGRSSIGLFVGAGGNLVDIEIDNFRTADGCFIGSNYTCDPHFIDPDNGNFCLRSDSPVIDAGNPVIAPGITVPSNHADGRPDIGVCQTFGVQF